ncbi:MAG: hypothetical protein ACE14S_00950 [Candidatus Bathyarchaeia archaeon]
MRARLNHPAVAASILTLILLQVLSEFTAAETAAKPTIRLDWHKDNGYSAFNDIYGQFTITASVSTDTIRVEFYVDDALQLNRTVVPFVWSFNTDDYPLRQHVIKAVAYDSSGEAAEVQTRRNFVPFPTLYVAGTIAIAVVVTIVSTVYVIVKERKKRAVERANRCSVRLRAEACTHPQSAEKPPSSPLMLFCQHESREKQF